MARQAYVMPSSLRTRQGAAIESLLLSLMHRVSSNDFVICSPDACLGYPFFPSRTKTHPTMLSGLVSGTIDVQTAKKPGRP